MADMDDEVIEYDVPDIIHQVREVFPQDPDWLWTWINAFTGVRIPREPVCAGHTPPFSFFAEQVLLRPKIALWHGPRGSGKSFLSAIDTHLASRFNPLHGTRILGGSSAQSLQIYQALKSILQDRYGEGGNDRDTVERLLRSKAFYVNGSEVDILTASDTSVRGPHVPSLKLDEVDEIEPELRESAVGICMEQHGIKASVLMSSTWHRVGGPMSELIARGTEGKQFPVHTYCMFEVLERCPEERSGPELQNCPDCEIMRWCHADRGAHPSGLPKAKRSDGHYKIDDLIQKVQAVSPRMFESDYLCLKPRAAGAWFTEFDPALHVSSTAEYNPRFNVHVSIDPGVETGGVWLQLHRNYYGKVIHVNVFADYYAYDVGAEANARAVMRQTESLCGMALDRCRYSMDSAATQRTSVGPVVLGEYERVGCSGRGGIEQWPLGKKTDQLSLVEAFVMAADRKARLTVHPRCVHLIDAFHGYRRATRKNQWLDQPLDPQHPHEDLIDPLRGALVLEMPEGLTPAPKLITHPAGRLA